MLDFKEYVKENCNLSKQNKIDSQSKIIIKEEEIDKFERYLHQMFISKKSIIDKFWNPTESEKGRYIKEIYSIFKDISEINLFNQLNTNQDWILKIKDFEC